MHDGWYIVYKLVGNIVECSTKNKNCALAYSTETHGYAHWCACCGGIPANGYEFIDTRTRNEKRKIGYQMESDHIYFEWRGQVDGDVQSGTAEKAAWDAARAAIKTKYP